MQFLILKKELLDICKESISQTLKIKPNVTADGGTSDGRFIAKICNQVIEFGLRNESIHQIDENIEEKELLLLSEIYEKILIKAFKQ